MKKIITKQGEYSPCFYFLKQLGFRIKDISLALGGIKLGHIYIEFMLF